MIVFAFYDAIILSKTALESTLSNNDSIFHHNFRHGEFFNRGYAGIYCHPTEDRSNPSRPPLTFEHGKLIAKSMNMVYLYIKETFLTV